MVRVERCVWFSEIDSAKLDHSEIEFIDYREIVKIEGNLGIKRLVTSLETESRNKLEISLTRLQIQAILYYMVDYWAKYIED